jgi:hypothetical protein
MSKGHGNILPQVILVSQFHSGVAWEHCGAAIMNIASLVLRQVRRYFKLEQANPLRFTMPLSSYPSPKHAEEALEPQRSVERAVVDRLAVLPANYSGTMAGLRCTVSQALKEHIASP